MRAALLWLLVFLLTALNALAFGIVIIEEETGCGAADGEGKLLIPCVYDFAEAGNKLIIAKDAEGVYAFDQEGRERFSLSDADAKICLAWDGFCVINETGVSVYDGDFQKTAFYEDCDFVWEGVCGHLILCDGNWGEKCVFLSNNNETRRQSITPFSENTYRYAEMPAANYYDDLLEEIRTSADLSMARYGLLDAEGEVLLEAVYEELRPVDGDCLEARTDGVWQRIDFSGAPYVSEED